MLARTDGVVVCIDGLAVLFATQIMATADKGATAQ
jgi:hypothetical protein